MGKRKSKKSKKNFSIKQLIIYLLVFVVVALLEYAYEEINPKGNNLEEDIFGKTSYANLIDVPEYTDEICVMINDNKPYFTEEDYTTTIFENYSELDYLGRCGVAYANICKEIMPPEGDERGNISSIHPTGWKQTRFNGEYLYNRCHLIAYSLSDEDANKHNLITGTRYFNVQGMLPLEMLVLDYIKENENNHVLYRVTPLFKEENLLATGVEMEAYSIEDNGKLSFNVFVYNVQPGVDINYKTGELLNN